MDVEGIVAVRIKIVTESESRMASTLVEARKMASEFKGRVLHAPIIGLEGIVSRNGIDKMLSHSAVQKSVTPKLHVWAVANIDHLFQSASLNLRHADKKNDPNVVAIHRVFTPARIAGMIYPVKMTVKELRHPVGNTLYCIEVVNVETPTRNWVASVSGNPQPTSTPHAGVLGSVAQWWGRVNQFERKKQPSWAFAKIAMACVSVGLLVLVVAYLKDPWELLEVLRRAAVGHPAWLLCAIVAFGGSLACGTLRWGMLARALGVPIGWRRTVQLYAVGHFYNVLIPGATGGDVVKAGCVAMDSPGRRAEAVASILAERLIGFVALAAVVIGVALLRGEIFTGGIAWVRWYCLGFGAVTFLGFGALVAGKRIFKMRNEKGRMKNDADGCREPSRLEKLRPIFLRFYAAIHFCMRHPGTFGKAFGLSLLNHIVTGLCTGFIGLSLGMELGLVDVVCVMAVVSSVAAFSMTPGGAGIREIALAALLAHIGMRDTDAVAVSLLMFAVILLWAVVGGACYFILRIETKNALGHVTK